MVFHLFERIFGTYGDPKNTFWQNRTSDYLVNSLRNAFIKIRLKTVSLRKKLKLWHGSVVFKIMENFSVQFFSVVFNHFRYSRWSLGILGWQTNLGKDEKG